MATQVKELKVRFEGERIVVQVQEARPVARLREHVVLNVYAWCRYGFVSLSLPLNTEPIKIQAEFLKTLKSKAERLNCAEPPAAPRAF